MTNTNAIDNLCQVELRNYQKNIIKEIRTQISKGVKRILVQAPTGSGKTCLTSFMVEGSVEKNLQCGFIVHRRELIKQSMEAFDLIGVDYGVVSAGFEPNYEKKVQICSIQSLIRRFKKVKPFDILWIDEAHHSAASTWQILHHHYRGAICIGLTATPQRLDGQGLKSYYDVIVRGPEVNWLIDNGYLSKYKAFASPVDLDFSKVHTKMGDYDKKETSDIVHNATVTGNAVGQYKKICNGKSAIVFAINIAHSQSIVDTFNKEGIVARHLDGKTPKKERDNLINDFKNKKITILSNVGLFSEGFDVPNLDAVIMLRPTQSLGMALQMVGRGLRPHNDKEFAYLIDHVGNFQRHGLPDKVHEWKLEGRKKSSKVTDEIKIKTCKKCYGVQPMTNVICQYCGHPLGNVIKDIKVLDINLVEITKDIQLKKKTEQGMCETMEDLIKLGTERGYKNPRGWAYFIMQSRKNRWTKKT